MLLKQAVQAVFDSWNNPRAITYRNYQGISHDMGTACVIMAMVFGNLGDDSGTGVLFSRSPATGERLLYGEFLPNAQGEDVVAGIRTPQRIGALQATWPQIYREIEETARRLETHYTDVQDIEFTVERGKLYILQTRSAKRTASAAVKIAVNLAEEGMLTKEQAIGRMDASEVSFVLMPHFVTEAKEGAIRDGEAARRGRGRVSRRGLRESGYGSRSRGRDGGRRARRNPRAPRNEPGRRPRHHTIQGRAHEPRRNDEPCGGGNARAR